MRWLALSAAVFVATIGFLVVRDIRRGYWSTRGAHVLRFTLQSRLMHRKLGELLVTPHGGGKGRPLSERRKRCRTPESVKRKMSRSRASLSTRFDPLWTG
jgi:hypothetical protein